MSWPDARIKLSIQIETDILGRGRGLFAATARPLHTTASRLSTHLAPLINGPGPPGPATATWLAIKNKKKSLAISYIVCANKNSAKVVKRCTQIAFYFQLQCRNP